MFQADGFGSTNVRDAGEIRAWMPHSPRAAYEFQTMLGYIVHRILIISRHYRDQQS